MCASGPNFGGCGKTGRLAEPVEQLVVEWILRQLSGPALSAALAAATGENQAERELLHALQADQDRLDELVDAFADGTLSQGDFARARARVEARMDTTRRRLAGQAASRTLATLPTGERALREAWHSRGLSWRRAVLAAVVERVALHPCLPGRNVFDPPASRPWRRRASTARRSRFPGSSAVTPPRKHG